MKYRICNMEKAKRIKNRDGILRRNKLLSINLRQNCILYKLNVNKIIEIIEIIEIIDNRKKWILILVT